MSKNIWLSTFLILFGHFFLAGQVINIPDPIFKNVLVNTACVDTDFNLLGDTDADTNNDGEIQESEALAVVSLEVNNRGIQSMEGIEYFAALKYLRCSFNELTTLNIQNLVLLEKLDCNGNQLTELDVHNLLQLTTLECQDNEISVLDVENLVQLNTLYCSQNSIEVLDIQNLTKLKTLVCSSNQIAVLHAANLPKLELFTCTNNQINTLDVGNLPELRELSCYLNQIPELDLQASTKLKKLNCSNNQLATLNVENLTQLIELSCGGNQLSTLSVENLTQLQFLYCLGNQLSELNVQNQAQLKTLNCHSNQLTALDLQNLTQLEILSCMSNQITALDLQNLIHLKDLRCNDNQLQELNVDNLHQLTFLSCSNNPLGSLKVHNLPKLASLNCQNTQIDTLDIYNLDQLTSLGCGSNQLTVLDLHEFEQLKSLGCSNNQITELNIKNGSNESYLAFENNPIEFICCDAAQLSTVYNLTLQNSQTNCVTNTSCTYVNTFLTGTFTNDENLNCEKENGELGLGKRIIKAEKPGNEPLFAISNQAGAFEMGLDTGFYKISAFLFNNYSEPCVDSVWIDVSQLNDSDTVDVSLQNAILCPLLEVNIASNRMRRCYNNQYVVQYCNRGTAPAPNAQVTVVLSEDVSLVNSSIPGSNTSGTQWQFPVGELAPEACGSFTIDFYVNCDSTVNGQTICASAHITPDSICTPANTDWTGAQVMVDGFCEGDSVRFVIKNIGYGDMTTDQEFIVIEDDVILRQGSFNLPMQDSVIIKTPANGSAWRLEAGQEPTFPFYSMPFASVEGCGVNLGGLFSLGYITQFSEQDGNPFYSRECREITSSFDPNEKIAQPTGVGEAHFIYPDTEIEYQINFQNTGTDTAFTVVILDTLSANLDPASFREGISSHPYQVELFGTGILRFTFDHILLPDSNVNEMASHGFVRFRIHPNNAIPLGTLIENRAGIYFDFNAPIITNTVFHTVDTGFLERKTVWVNTITASENTHIFPNPVRAGSFLFFENNADEDQISLVTLLGEVVFQVNGERNRLLIPEHLPEGVYFLEWKDRMGKTRWEKLVVYQ